jgi:uncharacterized membrane protein YgaE (UPF0421/DUF939 family)
VAAERFTEVVHARLSQLRGSLLLLLQVGVGAGLAWYLATAVIGHAEPFFAPIAAVVSMLGAVSQRRRAVLELVSGVAVGILVGEALILLIGRGTWQVALVVALAYGTTVLFGLGRLARVQACTSAILLATITPVTGALGNPAFDRFLDALLGGAVGLLVTVLLPSNPVRDVEREVGAILGELVQVLRGTATALRDNAADSAWAALDRARRLAPRLEALGSTIDAASEVSHLSPLRRVQRGHVGLYADSMRWIDYAVRDARVLARRSHVLLRRSLIIPSGLAPAVDALADAVAVFADDLAEQDRFDEVRARLVEVAQQATATLPPRASLSAVSTVAQVRSVAADLMYASGAQPEEIDAWFDPDEDPASRSGPGR